MGEINFLPKGNNILISSNLVKNDSKLFAGNTVPQVKDIQQVLAVGPDVEQSAGLKVGDWVMINTQLFIQTVKTKSTIKAGMGGQDMLEERMVIPFFVVPGNDTVFIKMNAREIEGKILNYDSLPESEKSFTTLAEYEAQQKEINDAKKQIKQ